MVAAGLFHGEHVELFRGELVTTSPVGCSHSVVVTNLYRFFDRRVAAGSIVRSQRPLVCADDSEPEPDLAIVARGPHLREHPAAAALVIEVAESSREYDLGAKAALYAQSAVDEYWVIDLERQVIVIHRDRADGGWRSIEPHGRDVVVAAHTLPDAGLSLAQLLADG